MLCSQIGPPEFQGNSSLSVSNGREGLGKRGRYDPGDVGEPPPPASYDDSRLDRVNGSNPFLNASPARQNKNVLSLDPLDDHYTTKEETALHMHKQRSKHVLDIDSSLNLPSVRLGPPSQGFHSGGHGGSPQLLGTRAGRLTPSSGRTTAEQTYLSADDDILFVQIFINEVAIWMDSMDMAKHFANTVPYLALKSPMMLNALLACGARHLTLIGQDNGEKAEYHYGVATSQLAQSRQDQDRDLSGCAVTAVVLNAYGIMTDKPTQRMDHIAATRELISECGWDATSTGLGAACFWINVGMEVLSCIAFGWHTALAPDDWGLDLEFTRLGTGSRSGNGSVIGREDCGRPSAEPEGRRPPAMDNSPDFGDEELWAQRILYVLAKVANFRASTPQFQEPSPHDEQVRQQSRFAEWQRLHDMCTIWNLHCPQSMRVYGYSSDPSEKSLFPNIW